MSKYDTTQYLQDFDAMPPEKQRRHLIFIIRWAINIIKEQQAHALTTKPTSPLDKGAIDGECEVQHGI